MRCTDSTNACVWARFLPPIATMQRTARVQSAGAGAQPHPPGPAAGTVCSDSDRSIFCAPGTWHLAHQERARRLTLRFPSTHSKWWVCHFLRSLALALSCRSALAGVAPCQQQYHEKWAHPPPWASSPGRLRASLMLDCPCGDTGTAACPPHSRFRSPNRELE
jgi:hypothetical protein